MARPASRHGRYDAKVRYSPVGVKPNSSSNLDYHARGGVQSSNIGLSMHRPPGSRSERGHLSDHYQPTSPTSEEGPVQYSDREQYTRPPSRRNRQHSLPLDDMENYPRPWSSGSDEGYVPSPPPRPPAVHRPRPQSSRKRPVSSRKSQPMAMEEDLPDVTIMRPPSSFNKFRPLPSIANPSIEDTHSITSRMDDLHLASAVNINRSHDKSRSPSHDHTSHDMETASYQEHESMRSEQRKIDRYDISRSPNSPNYFMGPHPLPPEPSEHEDRLKLAIKLPTSGKRYHRYFSPEDYLQDVHHFAENVSQENLTDYVLACNAPRRVFTNLTQRICDVGLQDKTMLYFEETPET